MRSPSRILPGGGEHPRAFPEERRLEDEGGNPVDEAYRRGVEEGREEGRRAALEEIDTERREERAAVTAALAELAALRQRTLEDLESRILRITLDAASTIVRHRIDDGDPVAVRALAEALGSLPEGTAVRARLHPDDVPAAKQELSRELSQGRLELIADDAVRRGGCRIETDAGDVDATIETAEAVVRDAALPDGDDR